MFVCLFVRLFVCLLVFYFNHLGTLTEIYPENFVKIRLDLAEIFKIKNMFICLFVCLFVLCCLFVYNGHTCNNFCYMFLLFD